MKKVNVKEYKKIDGICLDILNIIDIVDNKEIEGKLIDVCGKLRELMYESESINKYIKKLRK